MSITFHYGRHGCGKRDRYYKKFPRHLLDKPNKMLEHIDINYHHIYGNLNRFLLARIGKPINRVYSEFLKHCDKSVKNYGNIKNWFYSNLDQPHNIFYVEDGILRRKKRNIVKCESIKTLNDKVLESVDFNKIIKELLKSKIPQYIGDFYLGYLPDKMTPVYMDTYTYGNPRLTSKKYIGVSINNYYGIVLDSKTSTYTIVKWCTYQPDKLMFYFIKKV